mmetsp:Transcript_21760/g.43679  ORF Transcript_21760/g.43679 Transcript_21760/m.43679 type:complete len:83 (-) Transcript_21760:1204-1452(-)
MSEWIIISSGGGSPLAFGCGAQCNEEKALCKNVNRHNTDASITCTEHMCRCDQMRSSLAGKGAAGPLEGAWRTWVCTGAHRC